MSENNFKFPPPPPPPPKKSENVEPRSYQKHDRPGNWNNQTRGGGRGSGRGGFTQNRSLNSTQNRTSDRRQPISNSRPGQKRDHSSAFHHSNQSRPRPQAPPSIPSFNAPIQNLILSKPEASNESQSKPRKKANNLLGLTPLTTQSDSESDDDEELKLASSSDGSGIQIEYNGLVSTLRNPADLAAWIAERRKRYPTQAKSDAAKKLDEERRQKIQQEKKSRFEARNRQIHNEKKPPNPIQVIPALEKKIVVNDILQSRLDEEKKRRRVLKIQRLASKEDIARTSSTTIDGDINTEHEVLKTSEHIPNEIDKSIALHSEDDSIGTISDSSELTESDISSSSGSSSESENDSAPEELSSKSNIQDNQNSGTSKPRVSRQVCRILTKYGHCKYGSSCKWSHDLSSRSSKRLSRSEKPPSSAKRKGLWQIMVEKEQEEERKQVLKAIIGLGKSGALDDSS